jgi:hypothetical protein
MSSIRSSTRGEAEREDARIDAIVELAHVPDPS